MSLHGGGPSKKCTYTVKNKIIKRLPCISSRIDQSRESFNNVTILKAAKDETPIIICKRFRLWAMEKTRTHSEKLLIIIILRRYRCL